MDGCVKDSKGKPVAGASVSIFGTYDGSLTDSLGKFHVCTETVDSITVVVTAIGFRSFEKLFVRGQGLSLNLEIQLKDAFLELGAVVVTPGSFDASDKKIGSTLNFIDVVTTAGANADIVQALSSLPGVQKVGEKEGLFVRGGDGSETKIFIDGNQVNKFFYSGVPGVSQRGRFAPYLFKGTVFATGGYSAEFGQALSSALSMESQDLADKSEAYFSLTSTGGSLGFQKLQKNNRFCFGGNYTYANLSPYYSLVKQTPYFVMPPYAHSFESFLRWKTTKFGLLKLYAYYSYNRMGTIQDNIDSAGLRDEFTIRNRNFFANLSYRERLAPGTFWKTEIAYSFNRDSSRGSLLSGEGAQLSVDNLPYNSKTFRQRDIDRLLHLKSIIEKDLGGVGKLKTGLEYLRNYFSRDRLGTQLSVGKSLTENYFAAFSEAELTPISRLSIKAGIRYDQSDLFTSSVSAFSPRTAIAYRLLPNFQVSAAYGRFYQRIPNDYLLSSVFGSPENQRASHYILNFQTIRNDRKLRVELFWKNYEKLFLISPVSPAYDSVFSGGNGYAQGIELFYRDRKSFKNFDYWISYSYLDSKRQYLGFDSPIVPPFVARHTVTVVLKRLIPAIKTQVNLSYNYSSPRNAYYLTPSAQSGQYKVVSTNQTPDLSNVNISLTHLPLLNKINNSKFIAIVMSVTNVLNQKQVFSYQYSYSGTPQAVSPTAARFFFVGFYLNLGVDRTSEIVENIQ